MQKNYNILTFSDVPLPSYTRAYRGNLFVDFASKGWLNTVYIVSPSSNVKFKNNKFVKVKSLYFKTPPFKNYQYRLFSRLFYISKLISQLIHFRIRNYKIDFIRTGSTYLSLFVLLTQKKQVPYFADICDFYSDLYREFDMPLSKILKPLIFWFEKKAINRADLVFVDTAAQREYIVEKFRFSSKRCVVLPNGILKEYYPFALKKDGNVLSHYGFNTKDKIIFYGGDISKIDGVEMVLKYVEQNRNIKALIIGKGNSKYIEELQQYIIDKNLKNNIVIDSFKHPKEAYKYISIADVCLAPFKITPTTSTVECGKIISYLMMGKPVVATNAAGVKSLYKENLAYFTDGNFDDFSNRLTLLLRYPISIKRMKELREIGERFDFKKIIKYEYNVIDKYFDDPNQDFSKFDYA